MLQNVSTELRYTSFAKWGYGISDHYTYNAEKKILEKEGLEGQEGYKCQAICLLSVTWLWMINYENWCNGTLIFISFAIVSISSGPPFLKSCVTFLHSNIFAGQSSIIISNHFKPIKIYTFRILYTCQLSRSMCESHTCGRHRSHASRTISLTWLTNTDKLFFSSW